MLNKKLEVEKPIDRWRALVGAEVGENPYLNLIEVIRRCTTREEFSNLWSRASFRHYRLEKIVAKSPVTFRNRDGQTTPAETILSEFATEMLAIGFIRGMQLGRELDTKTEGTLGPILKHSAVRRLLIRPKPKATALEICRALDKVQGMPWPNLRKRYGTWEAAVKHHLVKVAITDARKAAIQENVFSEFLAVVKGVGDDGSILNQFRLKKYGFRP
jgi:hypothetical protein